MCIARSQSAALQAEFHNRTVAIFQENLEHVATSEKCPDQYLGQIYPNPLGWKSRQRLPAGKRPREKKCLLLILESPHIDEFCAGSPQPANGRTGTNIESYLLKVDGLDRYQDYGLVLVNAVQYQCSHGTKPLQRGLRDSTFTKIWNVGGKEDFIDRLRSIYLPGDVVVNACTKGQTSVLAQQLRSFVLSAINESKLDAKVELLCTSHPASWYSAKNRRCR